MICLASTALKMASSIASRSQQQQLAQRAEQTEALLRPLRAQLAILRSASSLEGKRDGLRQENQLLKEEIGRLKSELCDVELRNGRRQVHLTATAAEELIQPAPKLVNDGSATVANVAAAAAPTKTQKKGGGKVAVEEAPAPDAAAAAAPTKNQKKGGGKVAAAVEETPLDVRRLDMRVGRIVECAAHADADALYVETVDVGEPTPRTIVSGLVRHVPLAAMQGRLALFLLNLKPAKMRGVLSQGMIMCASSADGRVEVLAVPAGAQPGDLVSVEGFPRQPDAQLNPKKKIFEALKPELRVDATGRACFRGAPWCLTLADGAQHPVLAPTLTDAQIS